MLVCECPRQPGTVWAAGEKIAPGVLHGFQAIPPGALLDLTLDPEGRAGRCANGEDGFDSASCHVESVHDEWRHVNKFFQKLLPCAKNPIVADFTRMTNLEQVAIGRDGAAAANADLLGAWDKALLLINSPDALLLIGVLGLGYVVRRSGKIDPSHIPAILFAVGGICGYFLFAGRTQWQIALGQGFAEAVLVVGFISSARNTLEGPAGAAVGRVPVIGPAIVNLLVSLTGADLNGKATPAKPDDPHETKLMP